MRDAGHAELDTETPTALIVLASCPVDNRPTGAPRLWGKLKIRLNEDSMAYSIYQKTEIEEAFNCSYELNPAFRGQLESQGLRVTGESSDGSARIIELPKSRFFTATGFQPQLTSEVNKPHPLIIAYLKAALEQ
jgi:CTP synthase